jgi:hypothetical protein
MPTYSMKNIKTGEVKDMILTLTQREEFLASGEYEQFHSSPPKLVTHVGSIIGKTSGDWRDVLKKVKKESGRGNTIHT